MSVAEPHVDLARVVSLTEFEPLARAVMDPAAFEYVAGGAWDEQSLGEAEAAWRRRRLRPRVLVDVADVDPSTTLLGQATSLPIAIAPMAAQGLARHDGELAMARAAGAAGVPIVLSTMSSHSLEAVATAAPDATRWFQLYTQADPRESRRLVERAAEAGCRAIVLTVDLPVLGYRERDLRNAWTLEVPLGNFGDEASEPAELEPPADGAGVGVYDRVEHVDRSLTWRDLATIRSWSALPLVLKGILTAEDARLAVEHGVDGIVVSSHGARQLDRTVAPADALEEVVDAVAGRTEVWVDGGIRRGLDVVTAIALGARGVLVGRPMFWALAAGGQAGVERALAILRTETTIALALLGARTLHELVRAHVAG